MTAGRVSAGQTSTRDPAGSMEEAQRFYQSGDALAAQGRMEQAILQYERVLSLQPDHAGAHNNLGLALAALGQSGRAVAHFERAVSLRPDHAGAHNNLGLALAAQGRIEQAIRHYERALSLQPGHAGAHNNLGLALAALGRSGRAVAHFERAVALRPDYIEAHNNLGNALAQQGRMERAVEHYELALSLRPDHAGAHNNLGLALAALGQSGRAVAHFERALSLRPDHAGTHNNLALVLAGQGRIEQAILQYERALSLRPDFAEAHNNLGLALETPGRMDHAVSHYERAVALRPDFAEAHNNLGLTLATLGQPERAVVQYERALSLRPDYAEAYSNLLLTMNYASDKDPLFVFNAHLEFARRWEAPLLASIETPVADRQYERRLKIGYVSSDFRQHSVGCFIEPVLSHHDHERFEIFCYSNHKHVDSVTERLKSRADHWCSLVGRSDEQAAQQIRADQIDILVDLNGHTGNNRLLLFARKPAPVQVTWIGYPNTTGLSAMDYRFTDGFADPPSATEHLHSEKLVRLPECFSCYQPPQDAPGVSGLPAQERGFVTFGCFNNMAKINQDVTAVWARILQAVPGSRLVLKNPALSEDSTKLRVQQAFADLGVTPERLDLLGRDESPRAHLDRYRNVDIGLDPFPYNGTTTTCEALWMGVPVITLAGKTHAGRVGMSQMSNLGLGEFVAHTAEEYIAIAQRMATDFERLARLRTELRSRMAASPLTDGQRFTRNLEQAYRIIWLNWCRQAPPQQVSMPRE